jgi:hypothetical protein
MITMERLNFGKKTRYLKYLAEAGVGTVDHKFASCGKCRLLILELE